MPGHINVKLVLGLLCFTASLFSVSAQSADLPQVKADKSLVVFYRLKSFKGGAIRFNVNHAEGYVGQLLNGTYLYTYVEPGKQTFWSQVVSQDSITMSVEPGKAYYVKGDVRIGAVAGRPTFTHVPESQALKDLAGM